MPRLRAQTSVTPCFRLRARTCVFVCKDLLNCYTGLRHPRPSVSVNTPTRESCDLSAVSWTQATGMLRTKAMLLGRLSFLKGLEHMSLSFCLKRQPKVLHCVMTQSGALLAALV